MEELNWIENPEHEFSKVKQNLIVFVPPIQQIYIKFGFDKIRVSKKPKMTFKSSKYSSQVNIFILLIMANLLMRTILTTLALLHTSASLVLFVHKVSTLVLCYGVQNIDSSHYGLLTSNPYS